MLDLLTVVGFSVCVSLSSHRIWVIGPSDFHRYYRVWILQHDLTISNFQHYTHKDDLKDVTAAFGLDQKGTLAELIGHCHKHMKTHPELATNPHCAKLFSVWHTCVHRIQATSSAVHGPSSSLSVLTSPGPYVNPDMFPPLNLPSCPNSHILPPNIPNSHIFPPNLLPHANSHITFPPSNFDV